MSRRITVRAIILDESGKLFCVRLMDKYTKKPQEHWCLPGGGLNPGEGLETGLHREMIEETNVAPEIGELLYIQQYVDNNREQFEFFFHVTNAEDYKELDLSKASHAADELVEHGFINPTEKFVLPKLLATEDLVTQASTAQPTKVFNYM